MDQDEQIIHISLSASTQELLQGFDHVVKLPNGEQVSIGVSSDASSKNGASQLKESGNLQHTDVSARVTTRPLTYIVSISTSKGQEQSLSMAENPSKKKAKGQSIGVWLQTHVEAATLASYLGGC